MAKKRSKIEIHGLEARYYDLLLAVATLGRYGRMMERAIRHMNIQPDEWIADFGCGPGTNASRMARYLGCSGKVVGFDIGKEMLDQARKKQEHDPHLQFEYQPIDEPLPAKWHRRFDRVLISFVLHGFEQPTRLKILQNAWMAIRNGGTLSIVDWNEFNLANQPLIFRWMFTHIECELASEFISYNWKQLLREMGWQNCTERTFFGRTVRLLQAQKTASR